LDQETVAKYYRTNVRRNRRRHKFFDMQCYQYDFTEPASGLSREMFEAKIRPYFKKYVFQLEKGETGYLHFQGRGSLHHKKRTGELAKIWHNELELKGHLSPTSNNGAKTFSYVQKADTRVDGPWSDKDYDAPRPVLRKVSRMESLYPWQQIMINLTKEYDDRQIHVILDKEGNIGKSSFCKYMYTHKLGQPVPPFTVYEDLIQFVMSMKESRLYLVDMPRAMKKEKLNQFYMGIESLKDGQLYDKRYKGSFKYIDEPNIIIFTNTMPDLTFLSRDRWKLWGVKKRDKMLYKLDREGNPLSPYQFLIENNVGYLNYALQEEANNEASQVRQEEDRSSPSEDCSNVSSEDNPEHGGNQTLYD